MKFLPITSALILAASAITLAQEQNPDFAARKKAVSTTLREARSKGLSEYSTVAEKLARELIKDFPDNAEAYHYLVLAGEAAADNNIERARALMKEVAGGEKVPGKARDEAKGRLVRLELMGKPVDVKFTAVDGREVDLSAMKGKVVLVDFWATWCGPCVAALPHVKTVYDKLHAKGFEVVGISFDQEKATLESFVKDKGMEWPQYFDGKGWQNEFGKKYGIRGIPQMWLVNKKGELASLEGGGSDLEARVEKMLAE